MKKLMMCLGKYFCLMLGIFLFASSVPAFGQKIEQGIEQFLSPASTGELKNYRKDLLTSIKNFQYKDGVAALFKDDNKGLLDKILSNYEKLIEEEDKILSYTRSLDIADKEAMDILTYSRYFAKDSGHAELEGVRLQDRIILDKLNNLVKFAESESKPLYESLVEYLGDVSDIESSYKHPFCRFALEVKIDNARRYEGVDWLFDTEELIGTERVAEFENCFTYLKTRFSDEFYKDLTQGIERYNKEVYPKMTELFRQAVKPFDVLETAFKQMPKAQQEALRAAFTVRDVEVATEETAEVLMKYVEDFGKGLRDPKYYSKEGILKNLLAMPSSAKQVEYVDDIAEISSRRGLKNFISDSEKLTPVERNVVSKSITKGFWVLAGLGAIATAAYITDVAADNHFSKNSISPRELGIIAKNIENGTATIREKFAFFTHPATEEYVKKDPVYTLSLVQLASDIYAADELLQEAKKAQEQKTKDNVEKSFFKDFEKQQGKTNFGVGSL